MKVARNRKLELLKSSVFLSHKALSKNPHARNATHAENRAMTACVSLKYKPTPIGIIVSKPDICSKNQGLRRGVYSLGVVAT